ncbi:hypothetical protein GCM10010492_60760 [Saccharothrix mutabilis subsp. mutabilis]|uniref:Uncharacterized protein n=1 Tax=Saccharothrix mutabilis subsp. mutabilis TaxID=66855 RepID=A0ABN0UIY9_9PSEU
MTDVGGVRAVQGYLRHVVAQADEFFAADRDFREAAFSIDLAGYRDWLDAERVVVNVYQRYRELDPDQPVLDRLALFGLMAEWDRRAWS